MKSIFDVIIIGGGPGGATAAKLLAGKGKKVALVEAADLGGVCLNRGCIPTKFLLAATAPLGLLQDHKRFGSVTGELHVAFSALQKRKERFIKGSSAALGKSLHAAGISVFKGRGSCKEPGIVEVAGDSLALLKAADIILATGSRPAAFPGLVPDGDAVLDSSMLLNLDTPPESLIIVGAGAIGIEFSDFFSAIGTKVTLVEGMPRLVPTEDADIAEELRKIAQKSGRACIIGRKVASVVTQDEQAVLTFADGERLTASKALIAVGRQPNTNGLHVEHLGGTLTQRGFAAVNACLEAAPRAYAIGDMNGITLLAHAAEHQAEWVARRILGEEKENYSAGPVPSCVFGHTEIMRVGNTAKEAAHAGGEIFVSSAPFSINPIAQAHGSSAGFAKAVWDGAKLVGMAAIGHNASHLVTAAQLLTLHGHSPDTLHAFMFAHPTLDEILKSALTAPKTPFTPE